jgi:hypothetical protein
VLPQLMPAGTLVTVPTPVPTLATVKEKIPGLNTAVTDFAALIVTVQVPVPEQAPLQPPNTAPVPGVAVRVTVVPTLKSWVQALPHEMPAGLLVTVPVPAPLLSTSSGTVVGAAGPTLIVREHDIWPPLVTVTVAVNVPLAV